MSDAEVSQLVFALVKIALMVFTVIHIMFLVFVFRRILGMRKVLSTLKQLPIEIAGTATMLGLVALLIYIILLP